MTATFVPLAMLVSCDDSVKTYDIKASTKSDQEILDGLIKDWANSTDIQKNASHDIKSSNINDFWNKPEGNPIRIAAITTALGKLWGFKDDSAGDTVVRAILSGGVNTVKKDEPMPAVWLNNYKMYLLTNIANFTSRNHILESLQKFQGFLDWLVVPDDNYQNMKNVLVGGDVHDDFMIGIQNKLNTLGANVIAAYPGHMDGKTATTVATAPTPPVVNTPAALSPATPNQAPAAPNQAPAQTPVVQTPGPVVDLSKYPAGSDGVITPMNPKEQWTFLKSTTYGKQDASTQAWTIDAFNQGEAKKWIEAQYNLIKDEITKIDWLARAVPDAQTFKELLTSRETDTTEVDATAHKTAFDAGKQLRKMVVLSAIGSLWGVTPEKALDSSTGIEAIFKKAFGDADAAKIWDPSVQNSLAWVEKKMLDVGIANPPIHVAEIETQEPKFQDTYDYQQFITKDGFLLKKANKYGNLRSALGGLPDNKFRDFQEEIAKISSDPKLAALNMLDGVTYTVVTNGYTPRQVKGISGMTDIIQSPVSTKTHAATEVDKWIDEAWVATKDALDDKVFFKKDIDKDFFKKYFLETKSTTVIYTAAQTGAADITAEKIGEKMRTAFMYTVLGSLWNVSAENSGKHVYSVGASALPKASELPEKTTKDGIAYIEFIYTTDFSSYMNFLEWIKDPQNTYSNLRGACLDPLDNLMQKFENDILQYSDDASKAIKIFGNKTP